MKLLLTSAGVKNPSIERALLGLLAKPIAEASALCIPTAGYGHPQASPAGAWRFITGRAKAQVGAQVVRPNLDLVRGRCPHRRRLPPCDGPPRLGAVTTVTFEERDGATRVVVHELYASKAVLDAALASGSTSGWGEQFEQLDELIVILDAKV